MEKLRYEDLMDLVDPLWIDLFDKLTAMLERRRPVEALHARPPLSMLKEDPVLRAQWVGPNATALEVRKAALAPFDAEHEEHHTRHLNALDAVYAAHGWTAEEVQLEIERRCEESLRKKSLIS